jgi:hypothetical protein
MTIVCCWYDNSYNRPRLTAIADSRAATKDEKTGNWTSLNTVTTKLFKVRVLWLRNVESGSNQWRVGQPLFHHGHRNRIRGRML